MTMTRAAMRLGRHREVALGIAYVLVLVLLAATCVAAYRKALPFQRTAEVSLVTTRAGLELRPHSDVKIQGRIVGEVRSITSDGGRAVVELGIEPDELDLIPADVDAAIVPKTLFGEKYVDLISPQRPSAARLAEGAVITQSETATEIGDVYAHLVPLLRAVDPAQLSIVLNTLASTLRGRGEQLGRTIDRLGTFLGELNPHLDSLETDLRLLTGTLEVYDEAAPDFLRTLANASALSSDLLVPAEERFAAFLDTVTDVSILTRDLLAESGDEMVQIVVRGRPLLELLDTYAPMMACSIEGLRRVDIHGNQTTGSRGPYVLLTIDMFISREPYRYPEDLPTDPRSSAYLTNLPSPIRSWAPHCPKFGPQVYRTPDAQPRSLPPLSSQVLSEEQASAGATTGTRTTAPSRDTQDPQAERLAIAVVLARDLLDRRGRRGAKGDPELGGLLVAPMLADGTVEVP